MSPFEPVVSHFGPFTVPKDLENGPSSNKKCVHNGKKNKFSEKMIVDHCGCSNTIIARILSLFRGRFSEMNPPSGTLFAYLRPLL